MQFHVEVDEEKLRRWSPLDDRAYRCACSSGMRAPCRVGAEMREARALHLAAQQALADAVYARWLDGWPRVEPFVSRKLHSVL
jgi:hypothetical protein